MIEFLALTMNALDVLLYTGIFVFAMVGALNARTAGMDLVGGVVLAFLTGYGGGTLRDLLIGANPINWMNSYVALGLVLSGVLVAHLIRGENRQLQRVVFVVDALGIGLFTVGGIERSLQLGINEVYAVIMGIVTATGGGVIADVLRNRVPTLLTPGEFYASACLVGGTCYMLLRHFYGNSVINIVFCVLLVSGIRFVAHRWRLMLPSL